MSHQLWTFPTKSTLNLKRTRSVPGTPREGLGRQLARRLCDKRQLSVLSSARWSGLIAAGPPRASTAGLWRTWLPFPLCHQPHTAVVWTVNRACLHGYHKLPINYSGLQNRFRCFLIARCALVLYFSLFPFRFRWMVCLTSSLKLRFSIEMCL